MSYGIPEENDIPELNKCPKCGTFFETPYCPICGEYCPEEMRAGNRKKAKPEVDRTPVKGASNKPIYLRWWFILIVYCVMPIAALILIWMTDWKKWVKVLLTVLIVADYVVAYFLQPYLFAFITWLYQKMGVYPEGTQSVGEQAKIIIEKIREML